MPSDEVHELVVEMRPEGIDETQQGLEETEQQFDDTSGSVGDAAQEMEGFAQQWRGAMGAIVAGLAVASAGLLAQIPVVGEAMAGLGAILDAIAYQMDKVLRPVLSPLANAFYELSQDIYEADGALGTIIGTVATLASLFALGGGLIAGIAAAGSKLGFFGSTAAGASTIVGFLSAKLSGLIAWVAAIPGAVTAAAVAAGTLIGVFGVWILETLGVLDAIKGLGSWIRDTLPAWAADGITALLGIFLGPLAALGAAIWGFVEDGFAGALERASEVFETFAGATERTANRIWSFLTEFFSDLGATVAEGFKDAFDAAVPSRIDIPSTTVAGVTVGGGSLNLPQLGGGGGGRATGRPPDLERGNTPDFAAGGRPSFEVTLDGKRVDEGLRRHRATDSNVRGRYG